MRLSRLKEFIKLARTLNYTQTAGELFTTQPVLSRQTPWGRSWGARLFARSTHQVALTAAGVKALAGFEGVVGLYDSLLRDLKAQGAGLSSSLIIGGPD